MTCIAAIRHNDVVYMGADSFWGASIPACDFDHDLTKTPKIWHQDGFLVAMAGGLHFYQAMQRFMFEREDKKPIRVLAPHSFEEEKLFDNDLYSYVNNVIYPRIDYWFQHNPNGNRDWIMYLARSNELITLLAGGNIRVPTTGRDCNLMQGLGALYAFAPSVEVGDIEPQDALLGTLSVAELTTPITKMPFIWGSTADKEIRTLE